MNLKYKLAKLLIETANLLNNPSIIINEVYAYKDARYRVKRAYQSNNRIRLRNSIANLMKNIIDTCTQKNKSNDFIIDELQRHIYELNISPSMIDDSVKQLAKRYQNYIIGNSVFK